MSKYRMSRMEADDRAGRQEEFSHMSQEEIDEWLARRDDKFNKQLKREDEWAAQVHKIQSEKNKRNYGGS